MTPDIQAPFFFLLLLFQVLTVSGTNATTLSIQSPASISAASPVHGGISSARPSGASPPSTSPASGSAAPPVHGGTSPRATTGAPPPTTSPASGSAAPPVHGGTSPRATSGASPPTTSPASTSALIPAHKSTSSKVTMTQASKGTPSSVPISDTPTISASHITRTIAGSTGNYNQSIVPPTSSNHTTSQQLHIRVSLFFLSFRIMNLQYNSSLENPSTSYYQKLLRNISVLFVQTYKQQDFLGLLDIEFRPGSVVVELTLAFREGTTAHNVERQLGQLEAAAVKYNLIISGVSVRDVSSPSSAQSGSGVPGWGIALLVLVCVLVALAIIYLTALVVCQCRQKNYGQLDLFPIRDAYHPMSEYPTYHTHGRYVPPGSTKRSPFEEVSAGNGGSTLSYANLAATSANL
ncbi:mucin-1 [Physeter macrocephalus]|uniref:Mucin-1 n=1 Tax=Physeter macrocephalus TaxID=9755 RepID=A0A2Y9EVV8_PHYMC|nr:mucin-1 [Physeter catodon]|eukprot:XP_007108976.2 mucin-1 [Physeter catodon]